MSPLHLASFLDWISQQGLASCLCHPGVRPVRLIALTQPEHTGLVELSQVLLELLTLMRGQ